MNLEEIKIQTWYHRKKDNQIYFLKDKGFGFVALVRIYQTEILKVSEADFMLQVQNKNFIKYNTNGELQV